MPGPQSPHARPSGVKSSASPTPTPPPAAAPPTLEQRLGRHLEGWRPALVIVVIALTAARLVVPTPVEPHGVPLPVVDRASQARTAAARREHARLARVEQLPFAVRAFGEALRQVGRAAAEGDGAAFAEGRRKLGARVREARTHHDDELLLRLRAVQTELFLEALTESANQGSATADALELGGELAREYAAGTTGLEDQPAVDLASAFVVRWTVLAGLAETAPFSPTLDDWRALHRIRLVAPRGDGPARLIDQSETVQSLGKLDPDYPVQLAQGMLAYQLGDHRASATALRAFLDAHPSGPWQLRARNHLVAAAALLPKATPDDAP